MVIWSFTEEIIIFRFCSKYLTYCTKKHNIVFWAFVVSPWNYTFEMSYCLVLMEVEHLVSLFSRHSLSALPVLHCYIEILFIYLMFVSDISKNTLNILIVKGFACLFEHLHQHQIKISRSFYRLSYCFLLLHEEALPSRISLLPGDIWVDNLHTQLQTDSYLDRIWLITSFFARRKSLVCNSC